jgi:hypothetical protein
MKTLWLIVVSVSLVAALAGAAGAADAQRLEYRTAADPSAHGAHGGGARIETVAARPDGLELPDLSGDKPVFARWRTPMVKAGFLWLVLDQSKKGGPYDRLFIDANGDGKLRDETPVTPAGGEGGGRFGPTKISFPADGGPITYHLNVTCYAYPGGEVIMLYASSACWYEGRVSAAGRERRCLICDTNANGAFNDAGFDTGDYFCLEDVKAGQDALELVTKGVGKYLELEKKYYLLEVARDGSSVKFTLDEQVPLATIRTPKNVVGVGLVGPMGMLRPTFEAPGLVRVPAGKYIFDFWNVEDRKDTDGKLWVMSGWSTPEDKAFELSADREWTAPIGEPAVVDLKVTAQNGQCLFNLQLTGQLGERVSIYPKGGQPSVKLHITNEAGDYHQALAFSYG